MKEKLEIISLIVGIAGGVIALFYSCSDNENKSPETNGGTNITQEYNHDSDSYFNNNSDSEFNYNSKNKTFKYTKTNNYYETYVNNGVTNFY